MGHSAHACIAFLVPAAVRYGFIYLAVDDIHPGDVAIETGLADFVVFGKLFTSNPDLPMRFAKRAALVSPDPGTFYSPGAKGYTDFASL